MPRWIAFDQQTSSLLRTRLAKQAQENRIETFGRGALDYALAKPGTVVTLLPSPGGEIGLAIFRRPRPARIEPRPARRELAPGSAITRASAGTRAGGFLGLSDQPIFDDEPQIEPKKGWWRRKFWDD